MTVIGGINNAVERWCCGVQCCVKRGNDASGLEYLSTLIGNKQTRLTSTDAGRDRVAY